MTLAKCTCGADKFEGALHQESCVLPNEPQPGGRRTLEDPGSSFTRVRFLEGQGPPQVDSYQSDGSVAEIVAGQLECILIGTRIVDTMHGPGMVADIAITGLGSVELVGIEASFFCSSMLARLIGQVAAGTEIEVTRLADRATKGGRAHQYQVDILDDSTLPPVAEEAEEATESAGALSFLAAQLDAAAEEADRAEQEPPDTPEAVAAKIEADADWKKLMSARRPARLQVGQSKGRLGDAPSQ